MSPVKCVFCYSHYQFYYYERKLSIETRFWNKNTQRAKVTKAFAGYFDFNSTLEYIQTTILGCYRKFVSEQNRVPEVDELRSLVKKARGIIKPEKPKPELFEFIQSFIKDTEDGKHLNLQTGKPVGKGTLHTYKQTLHLMKEFSAARKLKLRFDDINTEFHKEFVHFLSQEYISPESEKHFKPNSIGKHITNIKTFLSNALDRKLTTNQDFKKKGFKVIREDVDSIYLTQDEITLLENHVLPYRSQEEIIRDLFIIGCYTGLRISDLKRLSSQHIKNTNGERYLEIEMQKTGKPVTIPINDKLEYLFAKYQTPTGTFFPGIHDQRANDMIKDVAAKIEAFQQNILINSTENGKRITTMIPKWQLITNHTARRSYATNKVLEGYPYTAIMLITGHKTEKAFLRYVKISGYDAIKIFKEHNNRIHKVA